MARGDQALLDQAYADWQAQERPGHEFLVVHDASRHLTVPESELIVGRGLNLGQRRNAGLRAATGDVLAVWDDDDRHHPLRLLVQCSPIDRGFDATCLNTVALVCGERRAPITLLCGWPQTIIAKTQALLDVGGWLEDEKFDGDVDVLMELQGVRRTRRIAEPGLYEYHQHGANVTGAEHWESLWRMAERGVVCRTD